MKQWKDKRNARQKQGDNAMNRFRDLISIRLSTDEYLSKPQSSIILSIQESEFVIKVKSMQVLVDSITLRVPIANALFYLIFLIQAF